METSRTTFASETSGGAAGRTALQLALLIVGAAAFVWLVNVLILDGEWAPDTVDALSHTAWVAILIPILAIVFILELLLLLYPAAAAGMVESRQRKPKKGDELIIGCPNCGCTFHRGENELSSTDDVTVFQCPHCDQKGVIRDTKTKQNYAPVDHWCVNCGKYYEVYKGESDCPHCHTHQAN